MKRENEREEQRSVKIMSETILSVKDLKTYFFTDHGVVKAVDGVDLELKKGRPWESSANPAAGKA